jgi:4-carboxymuconolactone decarboxylase
VPQRASNRQCQDGFSPLLQASPARRFQVLRNHFGCAHLEKTMAQDPQNGAKENLDDRFQRGVELMRSYWGSLDRDRAEVDNYGQMLITHLFADIWTREGLTLRERSMITITVLIAQGREEELKLHLKGALHSGIEPKAIEEMFIHLAHYVGVPLSFGGWKFVKPLLVEHAAAQAAKA